jgi:small redox-active disulfide protein 2
MRKIQILGTGCPKCKQLLENAREAVESLETDDDVVKIDDIREIMSFGVMITPALALDGQVLAKGKVLSVEEITELLG